jgi:hypothetical protein
MKTLALAVCGAFGLLAAVIILANYTLLFKEYAAKPGARTPSRIPLVGGVLGALVLYAYLQLPSLPRQTWSWWVLSPLALDPGGVVFQLLEVGCAVLGRRFTSTRRGRRSR